MTTVYRKLPDRIRGEVPDLDRLIGRVLHAWEGAQRSTDRQDVYLDSVALNLHRMGFQQLLGQEKIPRSYDVEGLEKDLGTLEKLESE